ncbi:PTS dihydroxyacetone transporter [Lactococcus hodotermopsidis]|uniref:PTS dihydroxyacetone transporter n=1 Tax=Pseudolactococcus hodotermopsidis TaxID=2709157 RepID=A0A6A0BB41_9LACT|nr:PTS lactose/cellobiose transporter subunit IIA [Lactococcus hodotermopsidis]GFH42659.1 PTS dihydroxyacetone transporter [Lactococcus hodotermopsidis]
MEEMELIAFQMIAAIGESKSFIMQAIAKGRDNEIAAAKELLKEAGTKLAVAHNEHFGLIQKEASGEKVDFGILFMHAEDQLMTTGLMKDMAEQMIDMYEKMYELTAK